MTRRHVLRLMSASLAASTIAARTARGAADDITRVASLGEIAARHKRVFGTAFDVEVLADPRNTDLYLRHARILTPDHSMKFWSIRPEENKTDFSAADRLVDFATTHHIPIRGHNLIWNDWNPPWVAKLSKARRIYWLERHIDEVVGRYAGRIQSWDVVNEAFWPAHGIIDGFRDGPWYDAMGKDYIRRAFLRAGRADPHAKLALNESGAEWAWSYGPTDLNRAGVLQLIDDVRNAGARIDIIGLECHWVTQARFDPSLLTNFLGELAEKKVDVYVTELDVQDTDFPDDIAQRDAAVAQRYTDLLNVVLRAPVVKAIITWELSDPLSWLSTEFKPALGSSRRPRPLPFDANCLPKPAYDAVARALQTIGV